MVSADSPATNRLAGINVLGWGFSGPDAIASDGSHIWAANQDSNEIDERISAWVG